MPEVAFFSSVSPDIDWSYGIKRFLFKPEITAVGGDVTITPGSSNVYEDGVYAAKSRDAQRSVSDLKGGLHTGMSGSSMASFSIAGIVVLVKRAMRLAEAITPFVSENMAFAVKAMLMRTAKNMGVPLWFQGAASWTRGRGFARRRVWNAPAWRGVRSLWRSLIGETSVSPVDGWGWLERLKAVKDAEDRVFREAKLAKSEAQARQEEDAPEEPRRGTGGPFLP